MVAGSTQWELQARRENHRARPAARCAQNGITLLWFGARPRGRACTPTCPARAPSGKCSQRTHQQGTAASANTRQGQPQPHGCRGAISSLQSAYAHAQACGKALMWVKKQDAAAPRVTHTHTRQSHGTPARQSGVPQPPACMRASRRGFALRCVVCKASATHLCRPTADASTACHAACHAARETHALAAARCAAAAHVAQSKRRRRGTQHTQTQACTRGQPAKHKRQPQ